MKFCMVMLGLSPRHYPQAAAVAEANGFESITMPEHLLLPATMPPTYPYSETGYSVMSESTPLYDPWVVLASVASATTSIRLSTNVYVIPLRHPFVTARSVVTLDRISNGRVTLGAGVGWLQEEFDAAGQSFHDRGKRMDEIVPLLRRLWTENVIEHHGEYYDFGPIKFEPKPIQKPTIPIDIGGHSPGALRRAGRLGDGWAEVGSHDYETFVQRRDIVLRAREEAGRGDLPFEISSGMATDLTSVLRLQELGVTRAIMAPRSDLRRSVADVTRLRPTDFTDWCKRVADTVIANVPAAAT
ncbi:MAG TPA: LLM class F420-dependent oxidoreductase [Acidimicrobiales bacterium]|nr:LLM class F420-dependent oxidoreductase [Acidimicrobiales bacterium]